MPLPTPPTARIALDIPPITAHFTDLQSDLVTHLLAIIRQKQAEHRTQTRDIIDGASGSAIPAGGTPPGVSPREQPRDLPYDTENADVIPADPDAAPAPSNPEIEGSEPYSVTLPMPASTGLIVPPLPTSPPTPTDHPDLGENPPEAKPPLTRRLWKGWWDFVTNEADYLSAVEQQTRDGPQLVASATPPAAAAPAASDAAIFAALNVHVEVVAHSVTLSLQVVKAVDWEVIRGYGGQNSPMFTSEKSSAFSFVSHPRGGGGTSPRDPPSSHFAIQWPAGGPRVAGDPRTRGGTTGRPGGGLPSWQEESSDAEPAQPLDPRVSPRGATRAKSPPTWQQHDESS